MVNLNKNVAVLLAIVFSLVCVQMVSAAIYYTPTYANVSENFMLNITVSAPATTGNITELRANWINGTIATVFHKHNIQLFEYTGIRAIFFKYRK